MGVPSGYFNCADWGQCHPGSSCSCTHHLRIPQQAHIGDVVTLNGTVSGITTIAVYLFVMGPDLDTRGVTLDNLNIPAGRGLFTTAPVQMNDGTWTYTWDTSVILGEMRPGKYTVYVVSSPVDRLRYVAGDFADS